MTTADQKNIRKEERWKKLFLQIRTQKRKLNFMCWKRHRSMEKKFLFVTEEEDGDSEAYILKEIADENDDVVYADALFVFFSALAFFSAFPPFSSFPAASSVFFFVAGGF